MVFQSSRDASGSDHLQILMWQWCPIYGNLIMLTLHLRAVVTAITVATAVWPPNPVGKRSSALLVEQKEGALTCT